MQPVKLTGQFQASKLTGQFQASKLTGQFQPLPGRDGGMHRLSPGTQVGPWRVEARAAQGAYGAIYRAVRVGQEHAGPVALKFSLYPWDVRFGREAELLSRLSHPCVPRLLDRGVLRLPSGDEHAFIVMEWVDGTPLYAWGQQQAPSYRQICRVLAQLARTLEAIHAVGAVHRDVKGDNVLVRESDSQPVLIDFGSCHFQGAHRLTWQSLPPATPAYFSPQACLFHLRSVRERDGYYPPSAADELFALGVTAYRLVMGQYPPDIEPFQDDEGSWQVVSPDVRPLLERNVRVQPVLREWILRLLSDAPEKRGTAAQFAEALEAEAAAVELPAHPRPLARARARSPWLAMAVVGACAVLLWALRESVPVSSDSYSPDAGFTAVGDTSPTKPEASSKAEPEHEPIAQRPPPENRQARPDAKGRCPGRKQVVINGGCWAEIPLMNAEECTENGYMLLEGKCFAPANEPPRKTVPTSNPPKPR
jgi:serine/threonine protein kinase